MNQKLESATQLREAFGVAILTKEHYKQIKLVLNKYKLCDINNTVILLNSIKNISGT